MAPGPVIVPDGLTGSIHEVMASRELWQHESQ